MKFTFLFVLFFFCLSINGQEIVGKYCMSFKDKSMGRISRCLEFEANGRFTSELITDIGIIEKGDYEVIDNNLILTYDLVDETEFVKEDYEMFEIKKNKGWSFEKYYEISQGVKIGQRRKSEFVILKNKKDKLKLKILETNKRITFKKNSS